MLDRLTLLNIPRHSKTMNAAKIYLCIRLLEKEQTGSNI